MRLKNKISLTFLLFIFLSLSIQVQAKTSPSIKLGGALRFNYNYSDWIQESKKKGGEFGFDVFRLNAKGSYKNLLFDAEYRFYSSSSGGGMLKHGWVGYQFNPKHQIQVGLNSVPFGIMPYTANNFFFNINYYLGLEDDADMGIKYIYNDQKNWEISLAFYKNSDINDFHSNKGISASRYGYDIAGRNKEVNQGNLQAIYRWGDNVKHEIGGSAQIGGIYNIDTEKTAHRSAFALHYLLSYKGWGLKTQYTTYNMSHKNSEFIVDPMDENGSNLIPNPDKNADWVEMAAYGANYNVATKADTYIVGLSYNFPINKGILDGITVYNDFSMMHKRVTGMKDSYQNVTGVLLSMGPIYTYLDYALGKNHAWLGEEWTNAFAEGGASNSWSARLNLNIGYYF